MKFERVCILGAGLLGGSVALALKKFQPQTEVSLWGRKDHFFDWAKAHQIDHYGTDLKEVVADADLIILATPVGRMPALVEQILEYGAPKAVFTDVGSVKERVTSEIEAVIQRSGHDQAYFIGSHPMAGSEKSGCEAAFADLFVGKPCVVEAAEASSHSEYWHALASDLAVFWEGLGAHVVRMTPEQHDYEVAAISHLPHAVASLTTNVALPRPDSAAKAVIGNGFLDTTRIASGNAAMWAEIMLSNKKALIGHLGALQNQTADLMALLESGDAEAIENMLEQAKVTRDSL